MDANLEEFYKDLIWNALRHKEFLRLPTEESIAKVSGLDVKQVHTILQNYQFNGDWASVVIHNSYKQRETVNQLELFKEEPYGKFSYA